MLEKDYIEIKKLYEAFLKTPGEVRLISEKGFVESIKEGVKNGLFGFGYISDGKIECKCINETPSVNLDEGEAIIKPELCRKEETKEPKVYPTDEAEEVSAVERKDVNEQFREENYSKVSLKLNVPVWQISTIARIANYLKSKFKRVTVKVAIHASDGEIPITEYDGKVMEALKQGDIEIEEENNK